ncbi:hypothetical protein FB567DRAFT_217359 [Paraphoma chrysanthemicola]|uniref:Uncharacterized protein n=1 Tax=Paraphoma chrysanthemicola TaxID=798071 RepID=A0A8K0QV00_9PLEO|nr:hypothetical protein FB567DRAFT_217359 [Paraphoma chrysanthemicola]
MFSFQNMSSKRRREDDSDSEDGDGYGYGYEPQQVKKSRTWFGDPVPQAHFNSSIKPSPSPPRIVSDVEAMTPVQSDYDEADSPNPAYGGAPQIHDDDMDMEDDDPQIRSQPQSPYASTFLMRPAMLNASLFGADPANPNGRIPTPIHPTFKRSGMNGLAFPTSGSAGSLQTSTGSPMPALQAPSSRKPTTRHDADNRSRRMPSPISEDEDIPDTPTALTQSQLSRLSFSQAEQMDTEDVPANLVPPTPRGRKRSGALTGVGRFSMGFRDDCEKCQMRVPGHYSHFLP